MQHCVTAKFRGGQASDKTFHIKQHQLSVDLFLYWCVLSLSPGLGKVMMWANDLRVLLKGRQAGPVADSLVAQGPSVNLSVWGESFTNDAEPTYPGE